MFLEQVKHVNLVPNHIKSSNNIKYHVKSYFMYKNLTLIPERGVFDILFLVRFSLGHVLFFSVLYAACDGAE